MKVNELVRKLCYELHFTKKKDREGVNIQIFRQIDRQIDIWIEREIDRQTERYEDS